MKDTSVRFRVATMPSADNFQLGVYATPNQQEREQISARTKAALAAAKARGVKLGNPQNLKRTNEKDASWRFREHSNWRQWLFR